MVLTTADERVVTTAVQMVQYSAAGMVGQKVESLVVN